MFTLQEKAHASFTRKNADLFIKRKITLLEALTGTTLELTHLDGRKLLIKTKPGDVIAPQKSGEADWQEFKDTSCSAGEDTATANVPEGQAPKLKEVGIRSKCKLVCRDFSCCCSTDARSDSQRTLMSRNMRKTTLAFFARSTLLLVVYFIVSSRHP